MPSPIKESIPSLPPLAAMTLHAPPSPGTHRALRKLQSAHNLGAKASNHHPVGGLFTGPSLISQQRLQQQRSQSPTRRQPSNTSTTSTGNPTGSYLNRSPQRRGRANSDAPVVHQQGAVGAGGGYGVNRRVALTRRSALADELSLERLLPHGPPDGDVAAAVESMRFRILNDGIKSNSEGMSQLRIYVWLIMLDCPVLDTDIYLQLIHRGASPAYSKIRNDTFRTLTTDPLFRRRVSEASLIRLLNAVAWKLHDGREEDRLVKGTPFSSSSNGGGSGGRQSLPHLPESPTRGGTSAGYSGAGGGGLSLGLSLMNNSSININNASSQHPSGPASSPAAKNRARALTLTTEGSESSVAPESGTYVQGMNVLAAPFLYAARSESEAFVAFHQLLTRELPGYIRGAMDGVHKGLALVDKVLAIVDEKLSKYLMVKGMSAEIYAFPSVLTLCACTPPLPEVLQLWDFLFAYGPHLNILCIVAQLMLIRSQIMASPSPNKLLRSFPALQAEKIKAMTLFIAKNIPDDVYAEIIAHAR